MLQVHVTDDRGAVTSHIVDRVPFLIGRSPQADLQVIAAGVWEEHASIQMADVGRIGRNRFVIFAVQQGLLSINGEVIPSKELKIGDEISLGAARILVSLAPASQGRLALHEIAVWTLLVAVVLIEALVIQFAK
jgi:hypothetical protein